MLYSVLFIYGFSDGLDNLFVVQVEKMGNDGQTESRIRAFELSLTAEFSFCQSHLPNSVTDFDGSFVFEAMPSSFSCFLFPVE